MTGRLSRIARIYYWPNGGSIGPARMDGARISWYFWCDRTQAGELWASRGKYHRFATFWEACKAQATIRAELKQ